MNQKNSPSGVWGWMILTGLILSGLACSFFERRVGQLFNQETEAISTATNTSNATVTLPTGTSALSLPTATHFTSSTEIQQTTELLTLISTVEWTPSGGYTSLRAPVSGDFQVRQALTLSAAELQVPSTCMERPDCRHAVAIWLHSQLQGVACLQTENVLGGEYCANVSFPEGVVFRLRGLMRDMHPSQWNYIPVLEILPASDVPCLEGEFRCTADNTCFANYVGYCQDCQGLEKERCACQSPQGDLPDGSECQYWVSGDVLEAGKCRAGVCK